MLAEAAIERAILAALLIGAPVVHAACTSGDIAGTNPTVSVVCGVPYSSKAFAIAGNNTLNYDLYYLKSDGLDNQNPIVMGVRGGGNYSVIGDNGDGLRAALIVLAQRHFDIYTPSYFMDFVGALTAPMGASDTTLSVRGSGPATFFPTSATPSFTVAVEGESMTVIGISGTSPNFTYTVTRAAGSAHVNGAPVYVPASEFPLQAQNVACMRAYLGHNAGVTPGVPGNAMDLRSWSYSAGTLDTLFEALVGRQLVDGTYCDNTPADYDRTRLTRWIGSASVNDIGCVDHYSDSEHAVAAWISAAPPMSATFTLDCSVTAPNASYLKAEGLSPSGCLPGSSGCAYVPPAAIDFAMREQIGTADTTVTPHPTLALQAALPEMGVFTVNGGTHVLDFTATPPSPVIQDMLDFITAPAPPAPDAGGPAGPDAGSSPPPDAGAAPDGGTAPAAPASSNGPVASGCSCAAGVDAGGLLFAVGALSCAVRARRGPARLRP